MTMDFYDWYQFWSTYRTIDGTPFFVADSWKKFKTEVTYITRGHLPDTPGISPYVIVRTLTDERKELRSLRTSSALEGMHYSMNSAQNSIGKA